MRPEQEEIKDLSCVKFKLGYEPERFMVMLQAKSENSAEPGTGRRGLYAGLLGIAASFRHAQLLNSDCMVGSFVEVGEQLQ
ncbi:MAG: hypothetical protein A2939_01120 [Parcubacteria group bacterium RIFCSPLOWO2_01_FULL_48_18]|nr:MAG: hypothetical protein A2939_01120 [Parcubacteria group bacterium RIFCSPLOWO2_01_FULL_48_18]OHB24199.1 MAG: hypothetical protein A3J67_02060 [Parcubacteria group bacterium RIFCSPHIGHO2_02_FULL_48_10b]